MIFPFHLRRFSSSTKDLQVGPGYLLVQFLYCQCLVHITYLGEANINHHFNFLLYENQSFVYAAFVMSINYLSASPLNCFVYIKYLYLKTHDSKIFVNRVLCVNTLVPITGLDCSIIGLDCSITLLDCSISSQTKIKFFLKFIRQLK